MTKIIVRPAQPADSPFIHDLSVRVQDALTRSGSLQEIGPIPLPIIDQTIGRGCAYLIAVEGEPVGSVFLEPLTGQQSQNWELPLHHHQFLSKLMVDPDQRGQQLGSRLVQELQHQCSAQGQSIVLDCWAGNDKLRQLYTGLGFQLHGVFTEDDYQIAVFTWSSS